MSSDLSIEHWLVSINMKDYFPLFMGYEEIDSLFHLKERDLEKLGVKRTSDRHKMLMSLANVRDTAYPGRGRTSSRAASLGRRQTLQPIGSGAAGPGNQSADEMHHRIPRSNSIKARFGDFFKKGKGNRVKRSQTVATADVVVSEPSIHGATPPPPPPVENRHVGLARSSLENLAMGALSNSSSTQSLDRRHDLIAQPWFHGMIMRKVADRVLSQEGDYLVRESISKPGEHVLTAKWLRKTVHFVINVVRWRAGSDGLPSREGSPVHRGGRGMAGSVSSLNASEPRPGSPGSGKVVYKFEREGFASIPELVEHYVISRKPISDASGCVLIRGVARERRPPSPLAETRKVFNSIPESPTSGHGNGQPEPRVNGHSTVTIADANVPPVRRLDPEYQRHLPNLDYTRMMCSTVLNQSSEEMARHLTRIDLQLAKLVLPEDFEGNANGSGLRSPTRLSLDSAGIPGGIIGLAVVNLPQGKQLRSQLLERFSNVSLWAASVIVGAGDVAKRKNILKKLIEMAHFLQGDALANVHGFMAIMRGLQSPQVARLTNTWNLLKRNDANTAKLYETKLIKLAHEVAAGKPTHLHSGVSLPYLEPLLEMLERKGGSEKNVADWEKKQDHFSLDALQSHLYSSRSLAISCPMYADAGFKRLSGHKVMRELDLYFRNDWPANLLSTISYKGSNFADKVSKFQVMLSALSEHAETTQT
eukprot:m.21780 g.21780  ORF g.21780 m.21780 type:complete len:704 (+) comp28219_c0_seq1:1342-3453(+)